MTPDYGVLDMAGNVLEWISPLSPVPYEANPLTQEKP